MPADRSPTSYRALTPVRVSGSIPLMADDQAIAPLLQGLKTAAARSYAAFHTPGHKRGQGAAAALKALLGADVFRADLPELPELDNLFAPEAVIQQAQDLAAKAFGAEQTWFLANGSTCGIEAAVLATCQPGDKLVLPRNAHQSAIAALILSGAVPIFLEPDYDLTWDLPHCVSAASVEAALDHHPDARAVLIVSPTYHGVCGDVAAIAQATQQRNIPLLVDEAHGAHFAFHPGLPPAALMLGADLAVQSTHKLLSALTQAAMLHVQGDRIDRDRLSRCLQLVQSTSPSYLLLASLDAARQQMAVEGTTLLNHTLDLADRARAQLGQLPGLRLLRPDQAGSRAGFWALDRTRLTVDVTGLGFTGFEADALLHQTLGVTAELPCLRSLTFLITFGNTEIDIDRLVYALSALAQKPNPTLSLSFPASLLPAAPLPMTPRHAFFAASRSVPAEEAIAQVSAELVCPYPPGVPVLFPGEMITAEAIDYLQQIRSAGGVITGCADASLQTLKIVKG